MKILLAFGAIGAAVYQLLVYYLTRKKFYSLASAQGTIVKSKLDNYNDLEGKRIYSANIEYSFTHQSQEIVSNQVALRSFQLFPNFNYESGLVSKYKEGSTVIVRYKSENPLESYIEVAPLSILSVVAVLLASAAATAYLVFAKWAVV